jgi:hypothetical protein
MPTVTLNKTKNLIQTTLTPKNTTKNEKIYYIIYSFEDFSAELIN